MSGDGGKPVRLWHIAVSHYNEKVRWALDLKGVEHERRAPLPGTHVAVALWLTRGRAATFPVLEIGGSAIGDSSAIVAELERRYPDPALYPVDPVDRERALALEEFFDEELGPHSRRLAFHHLRRDADSTAEFAGEMLPARIGAKPWARSAMGRVASGFVALRYRASSGAEAEESRAKVLAAFDRLEAELERSGGDHLVGDSFTIADLSAAALFLPVVIPPEGPVVPPIGGEYEEWRLAQRDRPGYRWVERMFSRHRGDARRP